MLMLNLLKRDVWDLGLYNDPILVSQKFISRIFNYSTDDKSNNNDTPPSDPSYQYSTSSQDNEPQKEDQKERPSSDTAKYTSNASITSSDDSKLTSAS
jgi:hypothetical protein